MKISDENSLRTSIVIIALLLLSLLWIIVCVNSTVTYPSPPQPAIVPASLIAIPDVFTLEELRIGESGWTDGRNFTILEDQTARISKFACLHRDSIATAKVRVTKISKNLVILDTTTADDKPFKASDSDAISRYYRLEEDYCMVTKIVYRALGTSTDISVDLSGEKRK